MQFRPYNLSTWIAYKFGHSIGRLFRRVTRSQASTPAAPAKPDAVPFPFGQGAFIHAAEIGDFVYCERFWWISRQGYLPALDRQIASARRRDGIEYHAQYSSAVRGYSRERRTAKKLIFVLIFLLALATALLFLLAPAHGSSPENTRHRKTHSKTHSKTASQPVRNGDTPTSQVPFTYLEPVRALLLSIAVLVLSILFLRRRIRRRQRQWSIPRGKLVYADDRHAPVLVCPELGLSGKPDAVWLDGHFYVPEERKTKRMKGAGEPFENHVAQLIAYCYLVAKHFGPVQRGLITYRNVQHSVWYTQQQLAGFVNILNRMRTLSGAGNVNRNHNSAGKCRTCIAFSRCEQALRSN